MRYSRTTVRRRRTTEFFGTYAIKNIYIQNLYDRLPSLSIKRMIIRLERTDARKPV